MSRSHRLNFYGGYVHAGINMTWILNTDWILAKLAWHEELIGFWRSHAIHHVQWAILRFTNTDFCCTKFPECGVDLWYTVLVCVFRSSGFGELYGPLNSRTGRSFCSLSLERPKCHCRVSPSLKAWMGIRNSRSTEMIGLQRDFLWLIHGKWSINTLIKKSNLFGHGSYNKLCANLIGYCFMYLHVWKLEK